MVTEKMIEAARDKFKELSGIQIYLPGEGTLDDFEQGRYAALVAAIEAALSTDAEPVKTVPAVAVKALRWKGPDSYGEYHSLDGLWGYIIRCEDDGHWLTEVGDYFRSPEAAQAAAQADYEARVRSALSAQVQDVAEGKQLDLNISKEWFEKRAALEGDNEIGAGSRKKTICIDPTPDEIAELFKIAHRIPEGWQLVPKNPTPEMITAARFYATDKWTRDGHGLALAELYHDMLAAAPAAKLEGKP